MAKIIRNFNDSVAISHAVIIAKGTSSHGKTEPKDMWNWDLSLKRHIRRPHKPAELSA